MNHRPTLHRRSFVRLAATVASATVLPRSLALAASPGRYESQPLKYAFDALEPHIDAKTMQLHHDKHYASYVKNLNEALGNASQVASLPLERILLRLDQVPETIRASVRNNGGGYANHTMFWDVMGPDGGSPSADLQNAIDRDFGGLDKLEEQFNATGGKVFGSGWVFVTADADGKLAIVSKPNQDTPLMDGRRVLFGNDLWEHAYYLLYQNRRADYLKAWWKVVNWGRVSERYAAAKQGTLGI